MLARIATATPADTVISRGLSETWSVGRSLSRAMASAPRRPRCGPGRSPRTPQRAVLAAALKRCRSRCERGNSHSGVACDADAAACGNAPTSTRTGSCQLGTGSRKMRSAAPPLSARTSVWWPLAHLCTCTVESHTRWQLGSQRRSVAQITGRTRVPTAALEGALPCSA